MTNPVNTVTKTRTRLLAAVASVAIAGAIGFGAVATGTAPVLADAVRVDAPQQMPSFADVVEKVSPAVVSVRVKRRSSRPPTAAPTCTSSSRLPVSTISPTIIR